MFEDFELITLLLNVNVLFFTVSYALVFSRILNSTLDFKNKVRKAEAFIARIIPNKLYESFYKKERLFPSFAFTGLLFILTVILVFYIYRFYNIAGRFYSGNIFDIIHLCITAFLFLIIPLFIPSIFYAFMYGYFPNDILDYIEGSSSSGIKVKEVVALRKGLKNEQWTNKVKFEFWLNLIWIIGLIVLLDFILTWRFATIWWIYLILLILCLIIAILVRKMMVNKCLLIENK
jgi:hypothetical protein